MSWLVGAESTSEGGTLIDAVRRAAAVRRDFELISWSADDSVFGTIPHGVWRALRHRVDGVWLSLSLDQDAPTTERAVPHGAEKYIEWSCEDLGLDYHGTGLKQAEDALFQALDRGPSGREVQLRIGRYSSSGQFNLTFSQALVQRLADHRVSIVG